MDAFRILRTRPDFQVRLFERPSDDNTSFMKSGAWFSRSGRRIWSCMRCGRSGRFVVHGHPFFTELQQRTVPFVSEAVGEAVECPTISSASTRLRAFVHRTWSSPKAKWTLDLASIRACRGPSVSARCARGRMKQRLGRTRSWENSIKRSPSLRFVPYTYTQVRLSFLWKQSVALPEAILPPAFVSSVTCCSSTLFRSAQQTWCNQRRGRDYLG